MARARSFSWELDNGFARHDYSSLASTLGPGILHALCSSIGRPELQLELISGLGDVYSASPSWGLWRLSREANASAEIAALLPRLKAAGASGILVMPVEKLLP